MVFKGTLPLDGVVAPPLVDVDGRPLDEGTGGLLNEPPFDSEGEEEDGAFDPPRVKLPPRGNPPLLGAEEEEIEGGDVFSV